jgi:hypothetical protein
MKIYRVQVFISGILLMVGASLPWATVTNYPTGASIHFGALNGDSTYTAIGGLILLVEALLVKGEPGHIYSRVAVNVSLLCAVIIMSNIGNIQPLNPEQGISTNLGVGLTCLSPIGILMGLIGGANRVDAQKKSITPQ